MILELEGKYRFLSNFYPWEVTWGAAMYPSVENAYQAAKCMNESDRSFFLHCKAAEAKKRGRVIFMRKDWDQIKLAIMLDLVRQKFQSDPLRGKLLATGDEEIQEGNWWGDTYWGTVNGEGENHLGKILMQVRQELKNEPARSL